MIELVDLLKEWGQKEGFWVSDQGCSRGTLKMAKTDAHPGYLRVTPEGNFYIYPDMVPADLKPGQPDFFERLKKLIMERTT